MQIIINRPITTFSRLEKGDNIPPLSMQTFAEEPCLFSSGIEYAQEHGGPLVRAILDHIGKVFVHETEKAKQLELVPVVDVRVQRLMPGMFPSIAGWHCDFVPRDLNLGQPNFSACDSNAWQIACTLSTEITGVSNTEFIEDPIRVAIWDKEHVYKDMHEQIERLKPRTRLVPDGVLTQYSCRTIHRASPCHRRGWRMYFRLSMQHHPILANKMNEHQQVYILTEKNGW